MHVHHFLIRKVQGVRERRAWRDKKIPLAVAKWLFGMSLLKKQWSTPSGHVHKEVKFIPQKSSLRSAEEPLMTAEPVAGERAVGVKRRKCSSKG